MTNYGVHVDNFYYYSEHYHFCGMYIGYISYDIVFYTFCIHKINLNIV